METLIQFKTAKLAQEKGVNIKTLIKNEKNWYTRSGVLNGYTPKEPYYVCSQSVLAKWLREEHNIDVFLDSIGGKNGYFYVLQDVLTGNQIKAGDKYNTFENSFEEGLFEALSLVV